MSIATRSIGRLGGAALVSLLLLGPGTGEASAQRKPLVAETEEAKTSPLPVVHVESIPKVHHVVVTEAPEKESNVPYELTEDPVPGHPGDESSTQPIPDFLKGNPYRLSYVGGDYTPPRLERLDPAMAERLSAGEAGVTYGFVMFQGRITGAKMKRVTDLGVRLGDFHTFQSYTAVIPFDVIPTLTSLECVRWVGYARPGQKVNPELAQAVMADPTAERYLFINVYDSDLTAQATKVPLSTVKEQTSGQVMTLRAYATLSNGPFHRRLEALGCKVLSYHDSLRVFMVKAPLALVPELVKEDFVHYTELCLPATPDHDRSTRMISIDRVRYLTNHTGLQARVGLIDDGAFLGGSGHKDLNKNGIGWDFGTGGNVWTGNNPHGTHVLGTICGTGTANNRYRGCAPDVGAPLTGSQRIFVGKIYDPTPATYPNNTLSAFAKFGADQTVGSSTYYKPYVINCSWGYGSRSTTGYPGTDNISRGVDQHVYEKGQTYVFSASNTGGTSYTNEYLKSVRQPNVAKNALTVGSTVDYRKTSGTTQVEVGQVWYSSGKGPTSDGRIKPNITAPGHYVWSCSSTSTTGYVAKSGTSMAAPHVTGVIASLTDYSSSYRTRPYLAKSRVCSTANPYKATRTFTSSSPSYYYRQGLGQVDAYKATYSNNSTTGWVTGYGYSSFSSTSAGAYIDVTIPADAKRTFFVLNFDEKESGSGATRACLADLDLYLDVEPFTAGYNTGEYMATRAWDTWEWYGNTGSIASVRGKKVRVKIYPRVRPASGTYCRWALSYMIPRGDDTPASTLSVSTSASAVRPNTYFDLDATVNVPAYFQTNSYLALYSYSGFTVSQLSFTAPDSLARSYTSSTINGYGDSILDFTLGNLGYFYSTAHRSLKWRMRSPSTPGTKSLGVRLYSDNRATTYTYYKSLCVDGSAPNTPSGLSSTSHSTGAWSNNTSLAMKWNAPTDNGCAGIKGLAYRVNAGSGSTPTSMNITGSVTSRTVSVPSSSSGWYFTLRAVDKVDYYSGTATSGPYYIDTSKPTVTGFSLDGGATYTTSLSVGSTATATDTYSGPYRMRYSANGSTWSPWYSYTTANRGVTLSSYGGSTAAGTKTYYVQVSDRAGNASSSRSDTIVYDPTKPVISKVSIDGGAAFTQNSSGSVTVTASDSYSGLGSMRYSCSGTTWSGWYTWTTAARTINYASYGGSSAEGLKRIYVQVRDRAGNISTSVSDTITYDKTAPVVTTVSINSGAAYTGSLSASVTATGSDGISGVSAMRYSCSGVNWSGWYTYSTAARGISLSSYGGNTNEGLKYVYVQVRDQAMNVSTSKYDTITYMKVAALSGVSPTTLTTVTNRYFTVTGTDLNGLDYLDFSGAKLYPGTYDDWAKGYVQVIGDTSLRLYPPQGLKAGTYGIRVHNKTGFSNLISVKLTYPTTRTLHTPSRLKAGKVLDVICHRGNLPPTALSLLTFSASGAPSMIPGLISLGHGGMFGPTFMVLGSAMPHNLTTGVVRWSLPVPAGIHGTFYFQTAMFDPANLTYLPVRVSNLDTTTTY